MKVRNLNEKAYEKNQMLTFFAVLFCFVNHTFAQNPIIRDQFTADPSARVFEARSIYILRTM